MNLIINEDTKSCYIDNNEIILTKTEYNLLLFLFNNKNKIFNRKEISNSVWNKRVSDRTVDTIISRLRKKLKTINIVTRSGFGYGLIEK